MTLAANPAISILETSLAREGRVVPAVKPPDGLILQVDDDEQSWWMVTAYKIKKPGE